MSGRAIRNLYVKEMREILRNWGTLIVVIFMPLLAYPTVTLLLAQLSASQMEKLAHRTLSVAVAPARGAPELVKRLNAKEGLRVVTSGAISPSSVPGEYAVLVQVRGDLDGAAERTGTVRVKIFFDQADDESRLARERVEDVLARYKDDLIASRLAGLRLPVSFVEPLDADYRNVASSRKIAGESMGRIFPLLLIVFVMGGAIQVAVDLTAGEKERRTIQTLLLTPLTRLEILAGKLLVILTATFATTVVNLVSISLTGLIIFSSLGSKAAPFSISPSAVLLSLAVAVPLVTLLAALFLLVGLAAKNQLEASVFVMPLLFIGIIPAALPTLPGFKSSLWLSLFPVANTALAIKEIFLGTCPTWQLAAASLSNLFYALLALRVCAAIFQKEEVLFGGFAETLFYREDASRPSAGEVSLFYLAALGLFFFAGTPLQSWNLYGGLVLSQLLLILLPVLLLLRVRKYPVKQNLRLNSLGWRNALTCLVLGGLSVLGAQTVQQLQEAVLKTPDVVHQFMGKLVVFHGWQEGVLVLAVIALVPAVIEEIAFRGLVLRGLESAMKPLAVCLVSGLLFALFHLNIWLLLPITLVGTVLAGAVMRTDSLYAGMIIHFVLNGANVLLANYAPKDMEIPWWAGALALAALWPALRLLRPRPARKAGCGTP